MQGCPGHGHPGGQVGKGHLFTRWGLGFTPQARAPGGQTEPRWQSLPRAWWLQTRRTHELGLALAWSPGAMLRDARWPGRHLTLAGPSKSHSGPQGGRGLVSTSLALSLSCGGPVLQPLCCKASGAKQASPVQLWDSLARSLLWMEWS